MEDIRTFLDSFDELSQTIEYLELGNLSVDRQSLRKILSALPNLRLINIAGTSAEEEDLGALPPGLEVAGLRGTQHLRTTLLNAGLHSRDLTQAILRRCYQRISLQDSQNLGHEERYMLAQLDISSFAVQAIETFSQESDVVLLAT